MDEATAKTKWCPFAQVSITGTSQGNWIKRWNRIKEYLSLDKYSKKKLDPDRCIASDCMAWREHEQGWDADSIHEGQGYCGLARVSHER